MEFEYLCAKLNMQYKQTEQIIQVFARPFPKLSVHVLDCPSWFLPFEMMHLLTNQGETVKWKL